MKIGVRKEGKRIEKRVFWKWLISAGLFSGILLPVFPANAKVSADPDTFFLKVHFLYGSKPARNFKDLEPKWFGGIWGGHVGIEGGEDSVLNFIPNGAFHWVARKDDRHSRFAVHSSRTFRQIMGGHADSAKYAVIVIPITVKQKQKFDSILSAYIRQTPYDYAFIGMRCGAAAYEILGQLGIVKAYPYHKTYCKIFYPRKLRHRLLRSAQRNNWMVIRQEGTKRRKWERDL